MTTVIIHDGWAQPNPQIVATGCFVAPDCLECPLTRCKDDDMRTFQACLRLAQGFDALAGINPENGDMQALAHGMGVSVRVAYRRLANWRKIAPQDRAVLLRLAREGVAV